MPSDEEKTKAIRLARAIASDISFYNEVKIQEGLENDNLFEVLREELEEGRSLYDSRVSQNLRDKHNYYECAVVDLIVRPRGHIRAKAWL